MRQNKSSKPTRGPLTSNALLGPVTHELINLSVTPKDSLYSLRERFYQIMRKHGVKQGTKNSDGTGILRNNPDWQGAEDIFAATLSRELTMMALLSDVPKDLRS